MIVTILSILPLMVCVVLSTLILIDLYHEYTRPRIYLLFFMITAGMLYLGHFTYFNQTIEIIPLTDTVYSFCNPAVFPLFYLYIDELTHHRSRKRRQLLYLLPSLICFLMTGTLYMLMTHKETQTFIQHYLYNGTSQSLTGLSQCQAGVHFFMKIIFALQIPIVFYKGWHHITLFNTKVTNNYSDTEGKVLSAFKTLLLLFAIASALSFVSNIVGRDRFVDSIGMLAAPSIGFSVILLLIGHNGIHQCFTAKELEEETAPPIIPQSEEPAKTTGNNNLQEQIVNLVDHEQLYLQPNLKINDLALRLHTNREYIYQAINIEMGLTFSDFINHKRIDHAAQLIKQNPKALLINISQQSGFSSVSSFYRNWKLFIDCSPKEYQQRAAAEHADRNQAGRS